MVMLLADYLSKYDVTDYFLLNELSLIRLFLKSYSFSRTWAFKECYWKAQQCDGPTFEHVLIIFIKLFLYIS